MNNRKIMGLTSLMLITSLLGANGNVLAVPGAYTESLPGGKGTEITECSYDGKGNLTRKSVSQNGQETEVFTYEYDEENNVIRFTDRKSDGTAVLQTTKYDYRDDGYTGVTEIYSGNNGEKSLVSTMRTEVVSHDGGSVETVSTEPADGGDKYVTVTQYDDTLGVLSRSTQKAGDSGKMMEEEYRYNEAGKLVSKRSAGGKDVWTEEASEYDADGYLVKTTRLLGTGDRSFPTDYSEYENDADGNCVLRKDYNAAGILTGKEAFELDESGHVVKDTLYDGDGRVLSETLSEYDEAGRPVREERTVF